MIHAGLKESVQKVLNEVKKIIENKSFDIEKNFEFKRKRFKDDPLDPYNNNNTLLDLDYDIQDVVNEVHSLKIQNFYNIMLDDKPDRQKPFYEFIKEINGKQVYIKLKINEVDNQKILCVSFHYAKHEVKSSDLPFIDL